MTTSYFPRRKSKKTLTRPFIDVILCGELDSGVEIGVRNPARSQIWRFVRTTFDLRFFFSNIGSIVKKIWALGKNPSLSDDQLLSKKEVEKNRSETLYRCDFAWRIGFRSRNRGETPGTQSNLAFCEDHFWLEIFFSNIGSLVKKFWARWKNPSLSDDQLL